MTLKVQDPPCDFGGKSEGPVTTYTVTANGKTVVVDLCETHAKPLERALRVGSTDPRERGSAPRGRGVPKHEFVPVD